MPDLNGQRGAEDITELVQRQVEALQRLAISCAEDDTALDLADVCGLVRGLKQLWRPDPGQALVAQVIKVPNHRPARLDDFLRVEVLPRILPAFMVVVLVAVERVSRACANVTIAGTREELDGLHPNSEACAMSR